MSLLSLWMATRSVPCFGTSSIASEIVLVEPYVIRFNKGARVLAQQVGVITERSKDSAFHSYTMLPANMACDVLDSISCYSATLSTLSFFRRRLIKEDVRVEGMNIAVKATC